MPWRPHSHARTNPRDPRAWGKCDRCGSLFNLERLSYQFDWSVPRLLNKRIRVCSRCMDRPAEQLRTVKPGPDPRPVRDPRPINNPAVMGGFAFVQRTRALVFPPITGDAGNDGGDDSFRSVPVSGDAGLDAGSDAQSNPVQFVAVPVVSDAGSDAGNDSAGAFNYYALTAEEQVAAEIMLQIVPPGIDVVQGYPGSPFSSEQEERASLALPIDVDPDAPEA